MRDVAGLIEALRHGDADVRHVAAQVLEKPGDTRAEEQQ